MEVDMENSLAGCGAIVHNQSKAAADPVFMGQISGFFDEFADQVGVLCFHVTGAFNVFFGDHQEMGRSLGVHVEEGQQFVIFIKFVGWDFARYYLAKNAVVHAVSL